MEEALLHELFAASQPEEKDAIVAETIPSAFPEEIALIARCCCLFHWFDEAIVEAFAKLYGFCPRRFSSHFLTLASLPCWPGL